MIWAYPANTTVCPGETLEFRFDSADTVRVARGSVRVRVPENCPAGAYIATFRVHGADVALRIDRSGRTLDARSARALFVVRARTSHAPLLVVLPLFTYQAYNVGAHDPLGEADPGQSLYTGVKWVSLHRPGGGAGGHPWDERNVDVYDRATPRHTFAHWDGKALRWLDRSGYMYDVCTDLDLHDTAFRLGSYRAVMSFGHHEYWTARMRDRIAEFVSDGGNAAFFGGNTMWFKLAFDEQRMAISRDGKWGDEWKTTGVTYARGGGRWIGERPRTEFVVHQPRHPLLRGLDLRDGDRFGGDCALAGYECDGAPAQSDLDVLAVASLNHWPEKDECGERAPDGHAALGVRRHGKGRIFTASTADWARAMACSDRVVEAITRNVLDDFGGRIAHQS